MDSSNSNQMKKPDDTNRAADSKMSAVLKKAAIIMAVVIISVLIIYAGIAYLYYGSRFLPGTVINGRNYSNTSVSSLCVEIDTSIDNYALFIYKDDEIFDTLKGSEIQLDSVDTVNSVKSACSKQNKLMWGIYLLGSRDNVVINNAVIYNKDKFNETVAKLKIYNLSPTVKSQNAGIEFSDGKYIIMPALYGNEIDKDKFKEALSNSILALENKISIEDMDCYIKPEITEDSQELKNSCNKANLILSKEVKMSAFGREENVSREIVKKWISFDDKGNIYANEDEINSYISALDAKFTTYKKDRQFKTGLGDVVTVKGGDYGRRLDTSNIKPQLTSIITDDNSKGFELSFSRSAMGSVENDIGTTYIEVDLTNQHLYMFAEGEKVVECDVVTGKPDGSHDTPQGVYKLKYKQLNATLNGPGYSTPVSYWMPFNGDIGLHDATWQPRFGGDRYISGGSHGCVNLPLDDAKNIYEHAKIGMPIVCYFGPKH